jgi:hypothetical protein
MICWTAPATTASSPARCAKNECNLLKIKAPVQPRRPLFRAPAHQASRLVLRKVMRHGFSSPKYFFRQIKPFKNKKFSSGGIAEPFGNFLADAGVQHFDDPVATSCLPNASQCARW